VLRLRSRQWRTAANLVRRRFIAKRETGEKRKRGKGGNKTTEHGKRETGEQNDRGKVRERESEGERESKLGESGTGRFQSDRNS